MPIVPDPDTIVVLRDQTGAEYRSQIIETSGDSVLLRQPEDVATLEAGARLLITWPEKSALWVLPVLVAPAQDGVWRAVVAGGPWREERRQFLRTTVQAKITINYLYEEREITADGLAIDLSEAAVRCAVSPEHVGLRASRTPVTVRLSFDAEEFVLPGTVLTGRPAGRSDLRLEVVVLFARPVERVEDLRHHL